MRGTCGGALDGACDCCWWQTLLHLCPSLLGNHQPTNPPTRLPAHPPTHPPHPPHPPTCARAGVLRVV